MTASSPPGKPGTSLRKGEQIFRLDGKRAFVSGASGHLGSAMARLLAEAGASVILNGREAVPLRALAEEMVANGLSAEIAAFDIRDAAAIRDYFSSQVAEGQRLDIIVNNAYTGRATPWRGATSDDFEAAYLSGPTAIFNVVKAAERLLRRAAEDMGDASIINISSMYGHISPDPRLYGESGLNSPPHYGASKGAVLQMTRYLACHLAPYAIRVNSVSPGPFPTEDVQRRQEDFIGRLNDKVPLGRIGRPDELSGAILFLASEAASYITGINLPVDGGWTAW